MPKQLCNFFSFVKTSAFVFGTMSFFDKIINGAFVLILEQLNPDKHNSSNDNQEINTQLVDKPIKYYQQIIVFVSGSAVILTFLGLLSIARTSLKDSAKVSRSQSNQTIIKL